MFIRLAAKIEKDSIVDGEGLRAVIWAQGCPHHCIGCHNPETQDFNGGFLVDVEEIKEELETLEGHDGVTLSGGDPLAQIDASLEIAQFAKSIGLNVWCYTGFTFDQLLEMGKLNEKYNKILNYIDILVDGKFDITKKSFNYKFRGSSNQRIIDVAKSLKRGKVCLVKKFNDKSIFKANYKRKRGIYI